MRKVTERQGTAFTSHTVDREASKTPEDFASMMRETADMRSRPWDAQSDMVDWVKACLAEEMAKSPKPQFRPHVDHAWYLREMAMFADITNHNIEKGDCQYAAHGALNFGMLYTEFQLKLGREKMFDYGVARRQNHVDGGKTTRKNSRELRVAMVAALVDTTRPRPLSVTNAWKRVGIELGDSWQAVRDDWYAAKKTIQT